MLLEKRGDRRDHLFGLGTGEVGDLFHMGRGNLDAVLHEGGLQFAQVRAGSSPDRWREGDRQSR